MVAPLFQPAPVPGDGKHRVLRDPAEQGTYKQPDNLKRLRKQAIKDFGVRQVKRAIYKQKHEGYAHGLR